MNSPPRRNVRGSEGSGIFDGAAAGREFSGLDSGAVREDFKIGVEHIARWERVAV